MLLLFLIETRNKQTKKETTQTHTQNTHREDREETQRNERKKAQVNLCRNKGHFNIIEVATGKLNIFK